MKRANARTLISQESGQSLIEAAILLPFLLALVLNAINFGHFFFVAINLASRVRTAGEYSVLGEESPTNTALPQPANSRWPPGTVSSGQLDYVSCYSRLAKVRSPWRQAEAESNVKTT